MDWITVDPDAVEEYAEVENMGPEEVVRTFFQTSYALPTSNPRRVAMHEMVAGEWKHYIIDTETGTVEYPEGENMNENEKAVVE